MDRTSRPSEHYYPQAPPAISHPTLAPPPSAGHQQPSSSTQQSPTTHSSQNYRMLPTPQHSTASSQAYPPNNPHGPPLHFPPASKPDRPVEHSYPADAAGHATPLMRHPPEYPLPQRTPSTPAHPPFGPPPPTSIPAADWSVDEPHPYIAHHEQPPAYVHYNGQQPPPPPHHLQAGPQMTHVVDQNGYAHPPPPPGYQAPPYMYGPAAMDAYGPSKKKSSRASQVSRAHKSRVDVKILSCIPQACNKCRERKSKCDEKNPCASCQEAGYKCEYRDGQPSTKYSQHDPVV